MSKLKNVIKKVISAVLAAIILIMPSTVMLSSAVTYPEGVSKESCEAAVPKLDALLVKLLSSSGTDISDAVYKTVLSDDTLNMLFSSVYSAIAENGSSLSVLGITLTPASLSAALKGFGNVSETVASCADINAVIKASEKFRWGVSTKERFADAVAAMFSPFNSLLYTVLCSGSTAIAPLVFIRGDDGYTNAIVPVLDCLGCPSVMSKESFGADAEKDKNSMMKNIVKMIFSSVDKFLEKPVEGCCDTLPSVAYFIDSGKLSECITKLIEPLSLHLGIISVPGLSKLLSSVTKIEDTADLSSLIKSVDLGALTGGTSISLPEINLSDLAACGEVSGDKFVPDRGAAFITVVRWLLAVLRKNSVTLSSSLGGAADIINVLLKKSDDELIKLLITLFVNKLTIAPNNYMWSYPPVTPAATSYTPTLTRDDYVRVLEGFDPLLDEIAAEKDPDATIYGTVAPLIFSNSVAALITTALWSAVGGKDTAPLFSLLGIDVTPAGVAKSVQGKCPAAAKTISKYSSWENINASVISFGFADGDRQGFENAVSAMLSPLLPLLGYVLAEKELTLFDAISLPGADGYNTAVIPLLEALGCSAESIKTYDAYKATAASNGITDILSPVMGLLDSLCRKPVLTACNILPNIIYFIQSDGLKACIENLLYPVTQMLNTTGLSGLMPDDLTRSISGIDLNSLITKLLSSSDISLKIPEADLGKLAACGNPAQLTSKRTLSGTPAQYTYVVSDAPAVLITALRFLVNTLSMEENASVLSGFMSGIMSSSDAPEEGSPDMMGMYVGNITEKFKAMTTDEIIEWLYDLLFRETPPVETKEDDVYVPADIKKTKDPVDIAKVVITLVVILVLLVFVLKFLYDKGYLDGIIEKHSAGKSGRKEKTPGKKLSRKEKKALKKQAKADKKSLKKNAKKKGGKRKFTEEEMNAEIRTAPFTDNIPPVEPAVIFTAKDVPPAGVPASEEAVVFTAKTVPASTAKRDIPVPAEKTGPAEKKAPAKPGKASFLLPLSDMDAKYIPEERPAEKTKVPAPAEKPEPAEKKTPIDRSKLLMPLSDEKATGKSARPTAKKNTVKVMPEIYSGFVSEEQKKKQTQKTKTVYPDTHAEKRINPAFIDELTGADSVKKTDKGLERRRAKAEKKKIAADKRMAKSESKASKKKK